MRPAAQHRVFHQTALRSADPHHSWAGAHLQYGGGRMDGFFKSSGKPRDRLLHRGRAAVLLLAVRRSRRRAVRELLLLDPRLEPPNHLYLMSGTSGGITSNGICCLGILDSGRWPIILDLLDEAGVTLEDLQPRRHRRHPDGETDNVGVFWSRWAHDPRTFAHAGGLPAGLRGAARCPPSRGSSRAPRAARRAPADGRVDRDAAASSRSSRRCARRRSIRASAFLLTYDEHGGFFDHVAPPQVDAYGLGHPRAALGDLADAAPPGRRRRRAGPPSTSRRSS